MKLINNLATISLHRVGLFIAAILIAAVTTLSIAGSVNATSVNATCAPNTQVCLFEHSNFGGSSFIVHYPTKQQCYPVTGFMDSKASSVKNLSLHDIRYYMTSNCSDSGCYLQDGPGDYRLNLANDNYDNCSIFNVNDSIRSFKVY